MTEFININGEIKTQEELVITPANRSISYGDGCFETIKMINGKIPLLHHHFERLFYSMQLLRLNNAADFHAGLLQKQITTLAKMNSHSGFSRIRLTIYRRKNVEHKTNNIAGYLIETWPGDIKYNRFNKKGLHLAIYTKAQKSCDAFSGVKSNSRLPYNMAEAWAAENDLDDALVCNTYGRIAESAIANIFIIESGLVKTPPLGEGCVNGVMRRYLLDSFKKCDVPFIEQPLTKEQVLNASEVFLTNAIRDIRWVAGIGQRMYSNKISSVFYNKFIVPLYTA